MDWCVKGFNKANHPPRPVLNGDDPTQFVDYTLPENNVNTLR